MENKSTFSTGVSAVRPHFLTPVSDMEAESRPIKISSLFFFFPQDGDFHNQNVSNQKAKKIKNPFFQK